MIKFTSTLIIFYCIFFIPLNIYAQNWEYIQNLFEQKNYTLVLEELANIEKSPEKDFYTYTSLVFLEEEKVLDKAKLFVDVYNNHFLGQKMAMVLGNFFYQKSDFKNAVYFLSRIYSVNIYSEEQLKNAFRLAYAYFMLKKYDQARNIFKYLKNGEHTLASAASYYWAYIGFLNNDYDNLVVALKKAQKDERFEQAVAELLPIVRIREGQEINKIEISSITINRFLGEYYIIQKDYAKALPYLEEFWQKASPDDEDFFFKIGYCYGKLNQWEQACRFLGFIKDEKTKFYAHAMYHLGVFSLQKNDKTTAALAFEKASQFLEDKTIQEEAFVNAAKTYFELQDFYKCILVAEAYLKTFAKAQYQDQIQDLLGEAYLYTQNYEASLSFLEKMPKTDKIRYAYQRLFFNRAVELFHDEKYEQVVLMLKNSLEYDIDEELAQESWYILGETYAQLGKADKAVESYLKIYQHSPFYQKAFYGLAYAYYQKNDLRKAINYFQEFIQSGQDSHRKADAYLRLADCFFLQKNYNKSMSLYDSALLHESKDWAYIDFQKALILKEQGRESEALIMFKKIKKYEDNTAYGIYAIFQEALILEKIDKEKAKNSYQMLIDSFPKHEIRAYARQRMVEIYIKEGYQALAQQELEQIYKEFRGTPIALEAYKKMGELKGEVISSTTKNEKNHIFKEGIRLFERRQYEQARQNLEKFVKDFPQEQEVHEAFYFLAESYANMGNLVMALLYYEKVQGIRRVEAMLKAAEIEAQQKDFEQAKRRFENVVANSLDKKALEKAKKGKHKVQIEQGSLKESPKTEEAQDLALAKALIKERNLEQALGELRKIVRYQDGEKAAQAKYLIAKVLRDEKHFESSNQECQDLIRRFGSYPLWVDEAYWLITENCLDLDNKFQARTALKELLKSQNPAQVQRAKTKLSQL